MAPFRGELILHLNTPSSTFLITVCKLPPPPHVPSVSLDRIPVAPSACLPRLATPALARPPAPARRRPSTRGRTFRRASSPALGCVMVVLVDGGAPFQSIDCEDQLQRSGICGSPRSNRRRRRGAKESSVAAAQESLAHVVCL